MKEWDTVLNDLRRMRDELRLQLHLAGKEAEQEWDDIVKEWDRFVSKAQLEQSAEEIGEAAKALGLKIKEAYERARKARD